MKKVFFAVAVFGIIAATSCKKDTQESVTQATEQTTVDADATAEQTDAAVNKTEEAKSEANVEIPQFSSPDVQKFAQEYADYFSQLMKASKTGDTEKIKELTQQGVEWTKKASEFTQKMTPEDAQKWIEWTNKLRDLVN